MRRWRWEEAKGQVAASQIYRLTELEPSLQQPAWCVVRQSCLASSYLIPENWSVLERTLDWHWENQDFNISLLIFISSFSGLLLSPHNINLMVNVGARHYSQRRSQARAKSLQHWQHRGPNSAQTQCWWGGTWCSVTLNILSNLMEPKLHWTVVITMWASAYKAYSTRPSAEMLKHAHSLDCAPAFYLPGRSDGSPHVSLRDANHPELHVVRM